MSFVSFTEEPAVKLGIVSLAELRDFITYKFVSSERMGALRLNHPVPAKIVAELQF